MDDFFNLILEFSPFIFMLFFLSIILRILYFLKSKKNIIIHREIIFLGFVLYVFILFQIVTISGVSWSTSNLKLFNEITRYKIFSIMFFKNVIGNIVLFIPFGFFISYFLKIKNVVFLFSISFLFSLSIELLQILIGRVFDVDDIVLNIIGSFLGFIMYIISDKIYKKQNK